MVLLVGVLVACCGGAHDAPVDQVLVSAAASLGDAFSAVEVAFEQANPGLDVVLNLGGSSTLREQILEGAPVDVFASADESNMARVVAAGGADGDPVVFATNSLMIAVAAGNPGDIGGLEDFERADLLLGLCNEGVPCGTFARSVFANAGVTPLADTEEPDVRALLTKIAAGELDGGITYVTDVAAAGDLVTGITIPADVNVIASYPITVVAGAPHPLGAEAFVDFVVSSAGRSILSDYGFGSP